LSYKHECKYLYILSRQYTILIIVVICVTDNPHDSLEVKLTTEFPS